MLDRTPIQLPPGVFRRGSEAEMAGRWYMSQLVRWVEGVMRPVGGWDKIIFSGVTAVASPIRAIHHWTDKNGTERTALLCEGHLYVLEGNTLFDISPVPPLVPPTANLLAGGYGDWGYGQDSDDMNPDTPEDVRTGGYGKARPDKTERLAVGPAYTLDNWGEDLLAMTSPDGRLLRWKPSLTASVVAAAVPNAPVSNRSFVVTAERHVMLMQMGGEYNGFGWCHQEDIENWAFTDPLSMAGRYWIEPAGPIVAARAARSGVLIFTPIGTYHSRYLALPYVYSLDPLGRRALPITAQSVVGTADFVVWPSRDGFWTFDGSTISPLDCDVFDWMQRQANGTYITQRTAGFTLGTYAECWWFFPAGESRENTHYLMWNFQERWWSIGQLSRSCGFPGTPIQYPLMSDGTQLFQHEKGLFFYDAPVLPFARSGAVNIADGDRRSTLTHAIVDTRAPADDVEFLFGVRTNRINSPLGETLMRLKGPYRVRADGKLDVRLTGRDIAIQIQSTRSGVQPWTFGKMLVRLAPRGQR